MNKLNQSQKIKIEECRKIINAYSKLQDNVYKELCEDVNHDSDWLWDYVFNYSKTSPDDYKKLVESHIFE